MNIVEIFGLTALLCVGVLADGHGDHGDHEMDVPRLKIKTTIKNEMFTLVASMAQNFPDNGKPSEPEDVLTFMKNASYMGPLSDVKVYAVWSPIADCTEFDAATALYTFDMTKYVYMGNSSDLPEQHVDYEGTEPYIFPVMYSTFVLQVNGTNYCTKFDVEEKNLKKIKVVFPDCRDFNAEVLRQTVEDLIGIDMKRVFVGRNGYDEGCHYADVYFQYAFEKPEMLHKLMKALSSKSGLGRYSGSDKCMTKVRETFLTEMALRKCYSTMMEEQKDGYEMELPKCQGSTRSEELYKKELKKYECLIAQYQKKYGLKAEGCMSKTQEPQATDRTCSCEMNYEAKIQKAMKDILTFIGLPLTIPGLREKKEQLAKLMEGTSFDKDMFEKLTEEIKKGDAEQMDYYYKAHVGICIVAAYGDAAMEKLNSVKSQVEAKVEAEEILRQLLTDAIKYSLAQDSEKMEMATLLKKIGMILGVWPNSNTKEDMTRVWNTLKYLPETLPDIVEKFNDMIDNEKVTNATRAIVKIVKDHGDEIARNLFLALYSPMEIPDHEKIAEAFMMLTTVMAEHKMSIHEKIRSRLPSFSLEELMVLNVLALTPKDTEKECEILQLAGKVTALVESMTADSQRDYGSDDSYYGDYSREPMGYPRDGMRYPREDMRYPREGKGYGHRYGREDYYRREIPRYQESSYGGNGRYH